MCVNPYIATRKDGTPVPVPCGKCLECRKQYQNEWIFRLSQEAKRSVCSCFVTLTYDDDHLPTQVDPETGEIKSVVCKRDFQLFMKRLRKIGGDLLAGTRYFAIGEYGARFNRAHMHAIIICPSITYASELDALVKKAWTAGFSLTKRATMNCYHYVCKYMNKIDLRDHLVPPFRLYSRSIGLNFLSQKMIDYYLSTFDRTCINGKARIGLPRYYQRKLDDISYSKCVGFKETGLNYSMMREEIKVVEGTKYFYFKDFTENYHKYLEQAIEYWAQHSLPVEHWSESGIRQGVWYVYQQSHKFLRDLVLEDQRLMSDCQIRNKLIGNQPVSYHLPASVILKECAL